ncbi:MAG: family 78 glycoside hydrolase catalytic domain [Burkholderiales bacterium]|nr:family 78 glycoside hydrolase catalytic domain [Phycisphaerae bacterium]
MSVQHSPSRALNLRSEFLMNPIGIDEPSPRLSWWVGDDRPGARQTAYRVRAASDPALLAKDSADLWDTGKISSDAQAHIAYAGAALVSRLRVWWDVQLWDADGNPGVASEAAFFETGLLNRDDWSARFIAAPLEGTGRLGAASPMMRKSFQLPAEIKSARLYITALGLYEAVINGKPVTDDRLRPGWTDYDHRLPVQTYDVTPLLSAGGNAIGVTLGDGWYCGQVGAHDRAMHWGTRPALLAQLEITLTDGTRIVVGTDDSWRWQTGPIIASDLIHGEEYDARREIAGWATAAFSDRAWAGVNEVGWPEARLVWSPAPPVRVVRELRTVTDLSEKSFDKSFGSGRFTRTFDFGQNFAGVIRLQVKGPAGCTLRLRYAEALKPDGAIDQSNLRTARCIDHYTLKGDPIGETYESHFTFHGFRYLELSTPIEWVNGSKPQSLQKLTRDSVVGLVLMSDTPATGDFECDHALLNRLQQNIQWGQRGNFLEVPTDCPQRDERLGWTGDAQIFAPTAAFNMDVAAFFTKWMRDVEDTQGAGGQIPVVAPNTRSADDGGPGWSDAAVVVPWVMYQTYGDRRILERHYPMIKKWTQYQISTARDGVRCYPEFKSHQGFGDWCALDGDGIDQARNATPKDLIGTAYYAYAMGVASEIATTLGNTDDASEFAARRAEAVSAFGRYFVTPSGRIAVASQTAHLMALAFDLLPDAARPAAVDRLISLIKDRNWHLCTGFLGTPLLCPVLSRFGRLDIAYKLLMQETYPGWLYPVSIGATTMWERWNSWTPDKGFVEIGMNSLNHYAYGAIGEWIYANLGGISLDPANPAYKHFFVAPKPGGGIKRAKSHLKSLHGLIEVEWQITGTIFTLKARVPANTTATITLPGGTSHKVAAGSHEFTDTLSNPE